MQDGRSKKRRSVETSEYVVVTLTNTILGGRSQDRLAGYALGGDQFLSSKCHDSYGLMDVNLTFD